MERPINMNRFFDVRVEGMTVHMSVKRHMWPLFLLVLASPIVGRRVWLWPYALAWAAVNTIRFWRGTL